MATIQLSSPIAGIRGKVGGLIYSQNGSSKYVRAWSRSSPVPSSPQNTTRNYLAELPTSWRALSSGVRSDWDDWAALGAQELTDAFGDPYYISGFNWFCKLNMRLLRIGNSIREAAPTAARPSSSSPTGSQFRWISGANQMYAYWTDPAQPSEDVVMFCAVAPRPGASTLYSTFTFMDLDYSLVGSNHIFDYEDSFLAKFGQPIDGWLCLIRIHIQNTADGQRSSAYEILRTYNTV